MILGPIGSMTLRWAWRPRQPRPGPPVEAAADSVAGAELGAWHGGQDLLLVVDGAAVVGGDPGGVVGGDHQGIDVAARDGQPEVVTNEGVAQARILVGRAGHLVDAVDGLAGLLRVPGELRDACVAAHR